LGQPNHVKYLWLESLLTHIYWNLYCEWRILISDSECAIVLRSTLTSQNPETSLFKSLFSWNFFPHSLSPAVKKIDFHHRFIASTSYDNHFHYRIKPRICGDNISYLQLPGHGLTHAVKTADERIYKFFIWSWLKTNFT
jgi:hypothetical protein